MSIFFAMKALSYPSGLDMNPTEQEICPRVIKKAPKRNRVITPLETFKIAYFLARHKEPSIMKFP